MIAGLLALLPLQAGHAATVRDWRHDIDAIVHDIETIHPNPFTKVSRADFERQAATLKAALPKRSEEQRMVGAMRLVASIGDGHTELAPKRADFAFWYPIRIYQFTDGYFVTSAYKTVADLAGAQILEIAGRPAGKVIDAARTLWGSDNKFANEENLFVVNSAPLMRGLGYAAADGTLRIKAKLRSGRIVTRTLHPLPTSDERFAPGDSTFEWRFPSEVLGPPIGSLVDWTAAYGGLPAMAFRKPDPKRPPHLAQPHGLYIRAIPEHDAYYIQANYVGDLPNETFRGFFQRALAQVDKQKPRRLIIDLRYNVGGDGSKLKETIRQFIKREDDPPWKELYVLSGRRTLSAAVMMLAAFVNETRCSVVGEPPASGFDHYGDATTIDLPRVGLELTVSTIYHKLEDVGATGTVFPVDVPAPFSSSDYIAGRDPAVDAILNGQEMRSLPIVALEDGGAAAWKVFKARQQRYAKYIDWMKTRLTDLIHAIWTLNDQKRYADSLQVAQIAVALYPKSARAWGVLGDAQIATKQREKGLKSYRRALALDPYNLDNLSERAALRNAGIKVKE
jgi:hypothetical protein